VSKSSIEAQLAQLSSIRGSATDLARELAPFLRQKSNYVVAKAAEIAGQAEVVALAADLIEAFERLMQDPKVRDPGCRALIAIIGALVAMAHHAPQVYVAGVRHVQMEGSYGPPVDAASPLRGLCARGLVRMSHAEALYEVVTLLTQREIPAQVGAVRALGDLGNREAELLLRLNILRGRLEPEVKGECFTALLAIAPHRSLPFVAGFLDDSAPDVIEAAALALGESRLSAACNVLAQAWHKHRNSAVRRTILLAIAMLRSEDAIAFLIDRLESDQQQSATHALAALDLYKHDEPLQTRIQEILSRRHLVR
jgi:hypothetical protein